MTRGSRGDRVGQRRRFSSSTVRPMSLRIPLRRPFLSVRPAWIGTVTRRLSAGRLRVKWLPRWWDFWNPRRVRMARNSRAVRTGSFSPPMRDGHVHGADELLWFLWSSLAVLQETLKVALHGFSDVRPRLFEGVALAVTPWQGRAKRIVAPPFIGFDENREAIDMRRHRSFHDATSVPDRPVTVNGMRAARSCVMIE